MEAVERLPAIEAAILDRAPEHDIDPLSTGSPS
jgi:hypothetical protein